MSIELELNAEHSVFEGLLYRYLSQMSTMRTAKVMYLESENRYPELSYHLLAKCSFPQKTRLRVMPFSSSSKGT